MGQQGGTFVLTREHLCDGISPESLSAYANIPVKVICHDEFFHSEKIRRGVELTGIEKKERADGISTRLQELNVPDWQEEVDELITYCSAYNVLTLHPAYLSSLALEGADGWRADNIQKRHKYNFIKLNGEEDQRWVVVPKPADVSALQYMQSPYLPWHSTILTDPAQESWDIFWAKYTKLPVGLIKRAPDPHNHKLMNLLHELRHVVQFVDRAGIAQKFFTELDSDLFSRDIFRKQMPLLGIDSSLELKEGIFQRYSRILIEDRRYQLAPALEAIDAKRPLPDPTIINDVIENICTQIIVEDRGSGGDPPTKAEFIRSSLEDPETTYSLLRRCKNKGDFESNPLSLQIVNGVLSANEYFSEGITHKRSVINRSYQVLAV